MFPSRSAASPCGPESAVGSLNSVICPVAGSNRPSRFAFWAVYQRDPSGPTAGSCGSDPGVGRAHSRMLTFRLPAAGLLGEAPRGSTRNVTHMTTVAMAIQRGMTYTCGRHRQLATGDEPSTEGPTKETSAPASQGADTPFAPGPTVERSMWEWMRDGRLTATRRWD